MTSDSESESAIYASERSDTRSFSLDSLSLSQQESIEGWLFVLPKLAILLFVIGFPMAFGIYLSFTESTLLNLPGEFVGLENYQWLVNYPVWWTSVKNVLIMSAVKIPTNIFFSFTAALLLREKLKGSNLYRIAFIVPVAGPPVIWAIVWRLMLFSNEGGIANAILLELGAISQYIPFLTNVTYALPSVIMSQIWSFGLSMLIYMAALSGLPSSVMESASMDGANKYQKVRYIIWPLMKPTTLFLVVIQLIEVTKVGFASVFVMTGGGPLNSTMVPSFLVYELAFRYNEFGHASAVAVGMFLITAFIALVLYKPLQSNAEYYQ
ncbi:carbohydrate ABC transporter permease [Haloferax marisrubri]|uniref:Sugar ABC transporter permease n=1 Tax=Haloferax marisrubri TaxID=1544719 RepID=A0A2P4NLV2_9EURY|nr:sugar ABC transporter permease [Haloferax marisrubri]POG54096.1 sugar ABC transporter permease [Haloferax marisrubri]